MKKFRPTSMKNVRLMQINYRHYAKHTNIEGNIP